jgi:MATE family multidrug resistance protein
MLLLIPVGRWLLGASGHGPAVLEEELAYFDILMFGGVTVPLGAAIGSFFTGRGDTRTNMFAQIAGNVANAVLDYAMIFGHWGFPEMGIRGAAIATVIAGTVAPGIQFALYFSRRVDAEYGTRSTLKFDAALFRRMIRFGVPSGWHLFLDIASFSTFVLLTGRMGAEALAASNIGFSINMVGFMPLVGIGIAASTVVGQYQGRKMPEISEKAGWTALKIGVTYMAVVAITYVAFPAAYFGWFIQRGGGGISLETLLETGRVMLWMMAAWGLLDAANLVLSFTLKGAGDTRFVMWYQSIMSWGLLVPGQWLITVVYHGTILQSWAWLTVYVWLLSIGFFIRFRSGKWKSIEVIESVPPIVPSRPGSEAMGMVE